MHLAKALEFRCVLVLACGNEIIPLQKRVEQVADDNDLEEVYNTERHLLYVAYTRAHDELMVTGFRIFGRPSIKVVKRSGGAAQPLPAIISNRLRPTVCSWALSVFRKRRSLTQLAVSCCRKSKCGLGRRLFEQAADRRD